MQTLSPTFASFRSFLSIWQLQVSHLRLLFLSDSGGAKLEKWKEV